MDADKQPTLIEVPLEKLDLSGENVRKKLDPKSMKILQATMKTSGLLQPIRVRVHPEGSERYQVVFGFRRAHAAKAMKWPTIRAIIVEGEKADEAQRHEMQMVENLVRADMNPIEKAEGIQKMLDADLTTRGLAARLGVTSGYVSQHTGLLSLPLLVRNAIATGKLDLTRARELKRLEEHEDKMLDLLPFAKKSSAAQVKAEVNAILAKAGAKAKKKKTSTADKGEDKPAQKSLVEQYKTVRIKPLKATTLKERLIDYATKLEKARSPEMQKEYKAILKGIEIGAGLSKG